MVTRVGGDPSAGASPMSMISISSPSALSRPASSRSASVPPSSRLTHAGASSEHHVSNSSSVLVRRRVGAAQRVALVAHDGEDLLVGEVAALLRHHAEAAGRGAGRPRGRGCRSCRCRRGCTRPSRSTRSAVGPRCAGTSSAPRRRRTAGRCHPPRSRRGTTSTTRRPRRPTPIGPSATSGVVGDRADVHEQPDRHQAQRGHRPERDLRPVLRRRDVRRVGLRGRRWRRRGGGLAPGGPGRRGCGGLGAVVAAGVAAGASPAGAASSPPPRPSAARRSRDRFSRCSGISVTRRHGSARPASRCRGKHRLPHAPRSRRTSAQPRGDQVGDVPD